MTSPLLCAIVVMGVVTLCDPLKSHLGGINEAGLTRTPNGKRTSGRDVWQEIVHTSIQTPGCALHTARPCLSHRGTETKRTVLTDRSLWCDEEMCPREGHPMPGGDEGVSPVLIFSSAWCSSAWCSSALCVGWLVCAPWFFQDGGGETITILHKGGARLTAHWLA